MIDNPKIYHYRVGAVGSEHRQNKKEADIVFEMKMVKNRFTGETDQQFKSIHVTKWECVEAFFLGFIIRRD